jgi:hypothetical protein
MICCILEMGILQIYTTALKTIEENTTKQIASRLVGPPPKKPKGSPMPHLPSQKSPLFWDSFAIVYSTWKKWIPRV